MKDIIFSNYDLSNYIEDIKNCIEEGIYDEMSDDEIYAEADEMANEDWECVWDCLKYNIGNKPCIFFGTLGRWDGHFKGGKIGNFEDLWYDALKACGYWEIAQEDGDIQLRCSHHDGTNCFTIKIVTDLGMEYYDKWNYSIEDLELSLEECHYKIICNYTESVKW